MAEPTKPTAATPAQPTRPVKPEPQKLAQARLILQDPLAWDQATQPSLRSSTEINMDMVLAMDREKAREMWESINLSPEEALERATERKRLLARSESLTREATQAKNEAIALKAQLAHAQEQRLNHPVVYLGAAGLLGLGALWWLERRKRMRLEERELESYASSYGVDLRADGKPARPSLEDVFSSLPPDLLPQRAIRPEPSPSPAIAPVPPTALPTALTPAPLPVPALPAQFQLDPALEDSLDLATDYATDLPGLAPTSQPDPLQQSSAPAAPKHSAKRDAGTPPHQPSSKTPQWAQPSKQDKADERKPRSEKGSFLGLSTRVLGNILRRKRQDPNSRLNSQFDSRLDSYLPSQSNSLSPTQLPSTGALTLSPSTAGLGGSTLTALHDGESTQLLHDDAAQNAFEQALLESQIHSAGAAPQAAYDPDRANIELLSQTRVTTQSGDDAMEHLLELRTAVMGLIALGRPQGAERLLEEHIAAHPTTCAWAYLEYMQLCEKLEERDNFESMRKRYRLQFNRMAPYWHEPNANVLGLDGYARAAGELCQAWSQSATHAYKTIAGWLVGPMLGRKLVQLPAYHDLLDLYEMLEYHELTSELPVGSGSIAGSAKASAAAISFAPIATPTVQEVQSLVEEQDFVPTVSLLDLDYEFSTDVTLEENAVEQAERAAVIVKPGNFSVDFNVAGTQLGSLSAPGSLPTPLPSLAPSPAPKR
jgi:hypothetical protein